MLMQQFCEATGLSRDTVRFYIKKGLLSPTVGSVSSSGHASNRYQVFDTAQIERAGLIRSAQMIGFSLSEIAELAADYEQGRLTAARKAEIIRTQLTLLAERAAKIAALRAYLGAKLDWVEGGERGAPPTLPQHTDASDGTRTRGIDSSTERAPRVAAARRSGRPG